MDRHPDADSRLEEELTKRAEEIADGTPRAPVGDAASPLLRRMETIAEVALVFQGEGPGEEESSPPPLFLWGPLEVRQLLGEGTFGQVYAAWDPRLKREVALKLRREETGASARRWLEEGRAQAQVRHPNVLTVYGADEHEGRAGIWTDRIDGRDLETILSQQGAFSEREAVTIGLELCGALAAVHARGLVHGDVKTRNVMREERGDSAGRIVLMDFGSAHEAALAATAGRGSSIGTPLAMAPEVLKGEPVTVRSDLYSLGVLLFRLVSGRYPVEAATLDELRGKQERGERLSIRSLRPALSREFVRVVERALEPDPRARYAEAAELERALHAVRTPPRGATRRSLAWGIAGAVLAITAWALYTSRHRPLLAPEATRAGLSSPPGETATPPAPPGSPASGAQAPARVERSAPSVPPLQADATLFRIRAGETSPLSSGGEIEPGDRLFVTVSPAERVNGYVLDEDGAGRVTVLFPCSGATARNPLQAGAAHRLPGAAEGSALNWLVTSAEGRETFLVVLSREPLAALESIVAKLPQPRPGQRLEFATLGEQDLRRLRGVSRLTRDPAPSAPAAPGRLSALARELGRDPESAGLWIRLIEVMNPRN